MDGTIPKAVFKFIKEQKGLTVLIVGIIVALVVLFVYRYVHQTKEGFGPFYDIQNNYTLKQRDYFWNTFNRGLTYNSGLEKDMKDGLAGILQQPDTMLNTIQKNDALKYFVVDPSPGIAAEEAKCNGILEPSLLPAHSATSTNGCGWWYMDDDNKSSTGARGSEAGPFDMEFDRKYPGGKWVWDLNLAQKLEDSKRCRKIKTCDIADLMPGKCGYCPITLSGIPIDGYGQPKYAADPKLSCPDRVIVSPSQCPKPKPPPPTIQPDGTVVLPAPVIGICDPRGGRLTKECLIMLAQSAGCSEDGALLNVLQGDTMGYYSGKNDNATKFKKANEIVGADCKIPFVAAFYGDGVCDRESALEYYKKLVQASASGRTSRCKEASGFLVRGTDFDPCEFDKDQLGPFDLYCLQRNFKEAGCQPDGSEYPTLQNKGKYDAVSWSAGQVYMKQLHSDMLANPDPDIQASATLKCLGITIQPTFVECGDKRGCEVLWYEWNYEWDMPERKVTAQKFFGREVRPTIPDFNTGGGDFNPYGRAERMAFHIRSQLVSKDIITTGFWVMTDDGVAIKADGNLVLRSFWDQGPTGYQSQKFQVLAQKPMPFNIYWYENYGGATFNFKYNDPNDGSTQPVPTEFLTMRVPSSYPLCRWDFYMGNYDDRNLVLSSKANNLSFGVADGKRAAIFNNSNSAIQILNHVRGGVFHTFSYMVFVREIPSYWSRLYSLRQGPTTCDAGQTHGGSTTIEGGVCSDGRVWMGTKPANQGWSLWIHSPPNTIQMNKWVHITYVYDMDWRGATVYVDGKKIQSVVNQGADSGLFDNLNCTAVGIGIGHYNWTCNGQPINCAMAWAHWFDYALTIDDVVTDRGLGFTNGDVYAESASSGWRARYMTGNAIVSGGAAIPTYDNNKTYAVGAKIKFQGQNYKMQEAAGAPGYAPNRPGDKLWVKL